MSAGKLVRARRRPDRGDGGAGASGSGACGPVAWRIEAPRPAARYGDVASVPAAAALLRAASLLPTKTLLLTPSSDSDSAFAVP